VGINNSITTLASDVVDSCLEVVEVRGVEWTSQTIGAHALHGKWNTEGIEAMLEEKVKGGGCGLLFEPQCQQCINLHINLS